MKGQEIVNQIVRKEMPDIEQVRENCHSQTAPQEHRSSRPYLRTAVFTAVAAALVISFFLFGNVLLTPDSKNFFSISAHALELQEDGSITLLNYEVSSRDEQGESFAIGTSSPEGVSFYKAIFINVKGANIKNVEFLADEGLMFKNIYLLAENGVIVIHDTIQSYEISDDDGNTVGYSGNFTILSEEYLGNSFTLNDIGDPAEGAVLFVGGEGFDSGTNVTIHALVTFNDGTIQEETFTMLTPGS